MKPPFENATRTHLQYLTRRSLIGYLGSVFIISALAGALAQANMSGAGGAILATLMSSALFAGL